MDGTARTTRDHGGGISYPLIQQASADALWHFCIHHYAHVEVQKSCMTLQNEFNGNINVVLLLAWLENAGFCLDYHAVLGLRNAVNETEGLLRRYRIMRRELKPQLSEIAYRKMLNYELSLEKFQQVELVRYVNQQPWHQQGSSSVSFYCAVLDKKAKALYPSLMKGLNRFS